MANNKMLIDAAHPEETRVVVVRGDRVEEFDFESANKAQLKGNIYLAKVTRVEPSLQAAFVDYGGNRHGFLAFSEIHPDYYQIPVSDREALIREEKVSAEEEEETPQEKSAEAGEEAEDSTASEDDAEGENGNDVESVGAEDALEEVPRRRKARRKRYKIQEVIKRRQILLVQVVKEERGNKGAALTSYLSLAGRYCVLMPNTDRGGGISRKITNAPDRKRLKEVAGDLDVPEGMGVIVRTAGANRTKAEIKRDYEYLLRLWENIRDLTLESTAPCLVYEEGNLVKRSIRDLYNKDIDQIQVEGEEGYKQAKGFMKTLMPSHARNVQPYTDKLPIFVRYHVESQLDAMFSPVVTLPSGGYLVINQAEALVAIDVNSGKATRKHSIEETALQTNMEAASEVARQLRLRDLAGLVVIDFIDMEEKRNNRSVERKLKDCLKSDRARIQVGRISHFGLLEMSRQRLRTSVLEGTTDVCQHCMGTGLIRSVESSALHIMRAIEMHALNGGPQAIKVNASPEVACYILNQKRRYLIDIEERFKIKIAIEPDDSLVGGNSMIQKGSDSGAQDGADVSNVIKIDTIFSEAEASRLEDEKSSTEEKSKRSRRRRKPRTRKPRTSETEEQPETVSAEAPSPDDEEQEATRKKRRRGKRGGRKHKRTDADQQPQEIESAAAPDAPQPVVEDTPKEPEAAVEEKPKPARRTRRSISSSANKKKEEKAVETAPEDEAAEKPKKPHTRRRRTTKVEPEVQVTEAKPAARKPKPKKKTDGKKASWAEKKPEPEVPAKPKRTGWWSSKTG